MKALTTLVLVMGVGLGALVLGGGWLLSRGGSMAESAVAFALESTRPLLAEALPSGISSEQAQQTLDGALAAVRSGDLDAAAVRSALVWAPSALLNGALDARESEELLQHFRRIAGTRPPAGGGKLTAPGLKPEATPNEQRSPLAASG